MPARSRFDFPQLPLALRPRITRDFEGFVTGRNGEVVAALAAVAAGGGPARVVLRGAAATGKSHLLEACCDAAHARGRRVVYVPLAQFEALEPALLGGLDGCDLVCADDVHRIAGHAAWEEGLFHLCNRADASGVALVLSTRFSPAGAGLALPDLESRLAAAVAYRLRPLDDGERRAALERRARALGFELPAPVTDYILTRLPRDMHGLMRFIERLDRSSLAAHRPITLPLVRAVLDGRDTGAVPR